MIKGIKNVLGKAWIVSLNRVNQDCNASADWLAKLGASSPLSSVRCIEDPT